MADGENVKYEVKKKLCSHVSHVIFFFIFKYIYIFFFFNLNFFYKTVDLVDVGSVINGAYRV